MKEHRETIIIIRPRESLAIINTSSLREFDHLTKMGYEPSFFTSKEGRDQVYGGEYVTFQISKSAVVIQKA